jgi:hypothetical protein
MRDEAILRSQVAALPCAAARAEDLLLADGVPAFVAPAQQRAHANHLTAKAPRRHDIRNDSNTIAANDARGLRGA